MDQYSSLNSSIFVKTYRSFLKGGGDLVIDHIIKPYIKINPSLHPKAGVDQFDIEGFTYTYYRLPKLIYSVEKIYLAQRLDLFKRAGLNIDKWNEISSPARRRKMYFDGKSKLAVYINSATDVDDFVSLLTAYQIEFNKLHTSALKLKKHNFENLCRNLKFNPKEKSRINNLIGPNKKQFLDHIKKAKINFHVSLIRGSYIDYQKAAQQWFGDIVKRTQYPDFVEKPVYFIHSNTHSIVNSITGWATSLESKLVGYMKKKKMDNLLEYWEKIDKDDQAGLRENLLWYVLKKYEKDYPEVHQQRIAYEQEMGIDYIEARKYLDVNVQIISLKKLSKSSLVKKLGMNLKKLDKSNGYIFNIDYPLGYGAYMVLSTMLANCNQIKGVYLLGKASFFTGSLGDVGLPEHVLDERSENDFFFRNAFSRKDFPNISGVNVLEHQKAASIKGTLMTYSGQWEKLYEKGVTIVEMENGPYLNALYEATHYERYPEGQTLNLVNSSIDIGIIHYASDTPFTKAVTLGTRNLGYEGVDATYASSLAILRRIIKKVTK
ncbi:DUF6909 family protein [Patescibacteria group bacterium]